MKPSRPPCGNHRRQGVFQPGEAEALWEELYGTFVRLTENASDYIASLQSARAEELMATEAFLAYKDAVTGYLQSFVQGLQRQLQRLERRRKGHGHVHPPLCRHLFPL
ncbi:hypothetical protein MGLY_19280 [Neomoorella glycerini]|uniref:Uncharacterized protein n=1 Tax=Neomoorella glycerini TaxID=55779 RepID=A0A6I5ZSH4_9FIRM|nr:hypothetical protein MGLY_19280 [Moorella glycerini]